MEELLLLKLLLAVAMILAPVLIAPFFLPDRRRYRVAHALALAATVAGWLGDIPQLSLSWLLFCIYGLLAYGARRLPQIRSRSTTPQGALSELARFVPFAFSNIGATWLVAGSNDYGLLGYGPQFSFYASLHGHVLGWIMLGSLAHLASTSRPGRKLYLVAVFVCVVSFLLIAFGIDGVPQLKPIGVVGLTLALPISHALFIKEAWPASRIAAGLAALSLVTLVATMVLAWLNELGTPPAIVFVNVRAMVSVHGLANGLVAAPSFAVAVALLDRRRRLSFGPPA